MSVLDTLVERQQRALVVADVRAFDPDVRISRARLEIMSGWKMHSEKWMRWSFDDVEVEGYFFSAHGAHLAGWREYLRLKMDEEQYAAYQAGEDGWMHV